MTSTQDVTKSREKQRESLGIAERELLAAEQTADALEAIRITLLGFSHQLGTLMSRQPGGTTR